MIFPNIANFSQCTNIYIYAREASYAIVVRREWTKLDFRRNQSEVRSAALHVKIQGKDVFKGGKRGRWILTGSGDSLARVPRGGGEGECSF